MERGKAKQLDQFFTQDCVAENCIDLILGRLKELDYSLKDIHFLEPSAGDGAFVRALQKNNLSRFFAYDIESRQNYIKENDFLARDITHELPPKSQIVTIGNPPFGKRARLAIDFINQAFRYSDTVAFILPLQFNKYSAQKQINPFANLVLSQKIDENGFLFEGEPYSVRCCLQIWTLKNILPDLRLREPPQIKHRDFEMWQYNNTREAEKYFDKAQYNWNFAVPRQGYKDYTIKETDPQKMDRRTQWIFFKAKDKNILHNLMKLDFDELSHKNTSTPGFGKADVVEAYHAMFGDKDYEKSNSERSAVIQTFQLGDPKPSFAGTLPLFETL